MAFTELEEFFWSGVRKVNLMRLEQLKSQAPAIEEKAKALEEADFSAQARMVRSWMERMQATDIFAAMQIPLMELAAFAFGLGYLLEEVDIIPDEIGPMGLSDDAALLDLVAREFPSLAG